MQILFVNSCLRGPDSRTLELCRYALEQIQQKFPHSQVEEVDLDKSDVAPLRRDTLALRGELEEKGDFSHPMFRYAHQFAQADLIVMGAPYWEYQFPALLRCYLEQISVGGITFAYGEDGRSYGKCQAGRLLYLTTSGGPIGGHNCGYDYVKTLCGELLGVKEFAFAAAQGLDVWGTDTAEQLRQAKEEVAAIIQTWR